MKVLKETSYDYNMEAEKAIQKYRKRDKTHWKHRIALAHRLVADHVSPRITEVDSSKIVVADIGCSIGTFAIEFAKQGYKTFGIDFDPQAIKIAQQLSREEGVDPEFICGDIAEWREGLPQIDIAICFDIFEHLHDDELGALLQSLRRNLSRRGSLVFHTFPTQYDYLLYSRPKFRYPILPFRNLSSGKFERLLKIYACMVDIVFLLKRGKTYKEFIEKDGHCNPTTRERLEKILRRAGYKIILLETSQIYSYKYSIQEKFKAQSIADRNLYGVAVPAG